MVKRYPAAEVNAKRRHAEWLREFGALYAPAEGGSVCSYCDRPAFSVDHVPGLAVFDKLDEAARLACSPRLYRCCTRCNRVLAKCASSSMDERRAVVAEYLTRPVAVPKPRLARAKETTPRKRATLASSDLLCVRLNGWRSAYMIFARDDLSSEWRACGSASSVGVLMKRLFLLDAPQELLDACAKLPPLYPAECI